MSVFRRKLRSSPSVAIIGAGMGGIAAAIKLKRDGIEDFTIFEKSDGLGGAWFDNTYPGAETDTPTHMYSFSFFRYPWTRSHARQPEIRDYLEASVDKFGIRDRFVFGAQVDQVAWDDERSVHRVQLADGRVQEFNFVISAIGLLNVPNIPSWPGMEDFGGTKFHSAQWNHDYDFTGKSVAIVGSGSTAVQLVPQLAASAEKVYFFQREPNWILPKTITEYTDADRQRQENWLTYRKERARAYLIRRMSKGPDAFRPGTKQNLSARDQCLEYIHSQLSDRPEIEQAVTPNYPFGGKRPVVAESSYYQSLKEPHVELIPMSATSMDAEHIVASDGTRLRIDALVMATGFQASNFLSSFDLYGRGGKHVNEFWDGEPAAYLGSMVPEFPNFFMLFGPNTNGMGRVFMLECETNIAVRSIVAAARRGAAEVEVRRSFYDRYNAWLQKRLARTVWVNVNNYFKSPSGRIVTQFPDGLPMYWFLTSALRRPAFRLIKRRAAAAREMTGAQR